MIRCDKCNIEIQALKECQNKSQIANLRVSCNKQRGHNAKHRATIDKTYYYRVGYKRASHITGTVYWEEREINQDERPLYNG